MLISITLLFSCACGNESDITDDIPITEDFIRFKQISISADAQGEERTISVEASDESWNVKAIGDVAEWLMVSKNIDDDDGDAEVEIIITENLKEESRSGQVVAYYTDKSVTDTLEVLQLAASLNDGNEDESEKLEVTRDIKYSPIAARVSDYQSDGVSDAKYVYDGSFSTMWHSEWSNSTFPKWLEVDVPTTATQIDYIIVYPRGGNGDWGMVDISYNTRENADWVEFKADYNFGLDGSAKTIYMPEGVSNIKTIRFVIKDGVNSNATCREVELYKIEQDLELNEKIDNVFTSMACVELKQTASDEDINKLPKELKSIATRLKEGSYPKEFRVGSYEAHTTPRYLASQHKSKIYGRADNPTGIWAEQGDEVLILVGETHGNQISIFAWDAFQDFGQGDFYTIKEGVNKIVMLNDALLYIYYYIDDITVSSAKPIDIHIPDIDEEDESNGYVNGYFDIEEHKTDSEYARIYDLAEKPFHMFDIVGKYCHLIYSRNFIPTEKIVDAFDYYEKMCWWNWEILGIDEDYNNGKFKLRHVFISNQTGYMDASDYRTHYHDNTLLERLDVGTMFRTRDLMWGPAHEVGHQIQPIFNFHGYTEGSNNFFSNLYSIKVDKGFKSRAQGAQAIIDYGFANDHKPLKEVDDSTPETFAQTPFILMDRSEGSDVFILQRMYWQLYIYYNMAEKNTEFWTNFFKLSRQSPYNFQDNPNSQLMAMEIYKLMCDAAKEDLTPFFEAWGWFVPFKVTINSYGWITHELTEEMIADAQNYVKAKNYPSTGAIEYIEDRDFMYHEDAGFAATLGDTGYWTHYRDNATVPSDIAVSVDGEKFTITNYGGVAAFELTNNGVVVFKSVKDNFSVPAKYLDAESVKLNAVQPDAKRVEIWSKN